MRRLAALALLVLVTGCASALAPAPVVTSPRFPEFMQPPVPDAFASSAAALQQDRAWRFLQSGDPKTAEHEFDIALRLSSDFYPAEAGLGYVDLARRDPKGAITHFDRALERDPSYVSALVGRGEAAAALNREADALAAYESAVAADPSLVEVRRRIEVLKFRGMEQPLKQARDAAHAGHLDDAARAYESAIAGSPDSAFLYRELGGVERQQGNTDRALEHFRKALSLDPTDAQSLVQIGDILASRADYQGAETAYTSALAIDPTDAVQVKLDDVRDRVALAALPTEYRAIEQAPQITRADLAALIGVRLAPLLQAGRRDDAVVITDVRNSWAAPWIQSVARAGVMEAFANHTFQPYAPVRRADIAQVVSRLLTRIAPTHPAQAKNWLGAREKFSDISSGHLAYPAASAAVASGVMKVDESGAFQPSKLVTGAEAVEAMQRFAVLAGIRPGIPRKAP